MMGWLGLTISGLLLLAIAIHLARGLGSDARSRFWIGIAAAWLSVGAVVTVLSPFHAIRPGFFLLGQAILLIAAVLVLRRRRATGAPPSARGRWPRIVLAALLGIMVLTGFEQFFLPVSNIDDRNYRAARAAYWLQDHTLILHDLNNDRDIAFPPGGSLPFFWAILFSRSETAGLIATWLAYPLVACGMVTLLREMKLSRAISLIGALVLCFTPIVLLQTRGLAPEMWLVLMTIGCGFWCVRAFRSRAIAAGAIAASSIFAVLAINVRTTAIPLLVIVLIFALLLPGMNRRRALAGAILGGMLALVFSGLGLILLNNMHEFGHPLGSSAFRHVHEADFGPVQLRTHFGRMIVALIDPPLVPDLRWRIRLEDFDHQLLRWLGARNQLPMEDQPWPGHWSPQVKPFAENFSIPGMLWLPALIVALLGAGYRIMFSRRSIRFTPPQILALLSIPFLLLVVFVVRWMGLMPRFWIAPYALGVAVTVALLARLANRRAWTSAVCIILILLTAVPAGLVRARAFWVDVTHPPLEAEIQEPYEGALAQIPPGSRILLVAGQGSRDYPLFAPQNGFANDVKSWGKRPFDASRMRRMIERDRIDYILVENDQQVIFQWDPALDTRPMVTWLSAQPDTVEVPLPAEGMRLFKLAPAATAQYLHSVP
jgi:hypothetical protein